MKTRYKCIKHSSQQLYLLSEVVAFPWETDEHVRKNVNKHEKQSTNKSENALNTDEKVLNNCIVRLSWETSTFKNYHSEDSRYSESGRIEFSSKSSTFLQQ